MTKYSANIMVAHQFAVEAHSGQTRDFSGEPYVRHPERVAKILKDAAFDEHVIIAALLHDTVEDTEVTSEEIHKKFGSEVGILVDALTEPAKARGEYHSTPKVQRKAEFLRQLEDAPHLAKCIKLADITDNTRDFCTYFDKNTVRAENFYFAKRDMLTRLYDSDADLYAMAAEQLEKLKELLIN